MIFLEVLASLADPWSLFNQPTHSLIHGFSKHIIYPSLRPKCHQSAYYFLGPFYSGKSFATRKWTMRDEKIMSAIFRALCWIDGPETHPFLNILGNTWFTNQSNCSHFRLKRNMTKTSNPNCETFFDIPATISTELLPVGVKLYCRSDNAPPPSHINRLLTFI